MPSPKAKPDDYRIPTLARVGDEWVNAAYLIYACQTGEPTSIEVVLERGNPMSYRGPEAEFLADFFTSLSARRLPDEPPRDRVSVSKAVRRKDHGPHG